MELKPGMSALVTGGASGIGKALSLALAQKGLLVTVVDYSDDKEEEVRLLIEKETTKFHPELEVSSSMFIKCDVTNASHIAAAFGKHLKTYGGLDICINCAGINSTIPFPEDTTNGSYAWKHTVSVNLVSVIDCTRLAIQIMQSTKKPGAIINMGSAAGLYPLYIDPIYSATKGGVILFTRALAPLKREGIRINVLCPEFVQTEMTAKMDPKIIDAFGGFLPMEMIVKGAFELIEDESKAGACLLITNRKGMEYCPTAIDEGDFQQIS